MARLLVVHHSPTPVTRLLLDQVVAGAHDDAIEGVEVEVVPALEAGSPSAQAADGYLLGTTANFGYMSGALKHFFDSHFLQVGGALADDGSGSPRATGGRPYGLYVHGRYDTTGAVRSVHLDRRRAAWRQSNDVLEVLGEVGEPQLEAAYELGGTLAALLAD